MPRADHRQREDVGVLARHLRGEFRERQLAHVPFAVEGEAREDFVQLRHQPGVLDAFGLHLAGAEVAEMVVVLGGDGEMQLFHFVRSVMSLGSMASFALATMSSGVLTKSATIVWIFAPATGATSRPALLRVVEKGGVLQHVVESLAQHRDALRRHAGRGHERPADHDVGREELAGSARASSVLAKSMHQRHVGEFRVALKPDLRDDVDLAGLEPLAVLGLEAVEVVAGAALRSRRAPSRARSRRCSDSP